MSAINSTKKVNAAQEASREESPFVTAGSCGGRSPRRFPGTKPLLFSSTRFRRRARGASGPPGV